MRDFFESTVDDWDDPSGQLHAYLLPGEGFRRRAARSNDILVRFPYLGVQPDAALHATLRRFPYFRRNTDRIGDVAAAATDGLRALGPVSIAWNAPEAKNSSILVQGSCPQWSELMRIVVDAASLWGPDSATYGPPFGAHMTLAYGIGAGPDEPILAELAKAGEDSPFPPEEYREIVWCAVHQNRPSGTYTFEVVATSRI